MNENSVASIANGTKEVHSIVQGSLVVNANEIEYPSTFVLENERSGGFTDHRGWTFASALHR
jgi:hypothetical protein